MNFLTRIILFIIFINHFTAVLNAQFLKDEGRIFLSTNNGDRWQRADNGFPGGATVNDFAFSNGVYFAGTDADGVFISTDNLISWQSANNGLPKEIKISAIKALADIVFLGSNAQGIFISDDHGKHWYKSNTGLTNLTVRCIYTFNKKIFAGTNDGIFISDDYGKSWISVLPANQTNGFTSLNSKIFAGLNKGAVVSEDNGETWKPILENTSLHNISNDGKQVFGMSYKPELLKTTYSGLLWQRSDSGLPNLYTFLVVNTGTNLLAGQWDGIYKSDDGGDSWIKSSDGLPDGLPIKELLVNDSVVLVGAGMRNKY